MSHITIADWLVISVYLIGITLLGVYAARKVKSSASFFIGDRKLGSILMIFYTFGAGSHADQAVSVAAKTYRVGASGIWYQWLWLFASPFRWLMPVVIRRMRMVTMADYFEARFDRSVGLLYAVLGILQLAVCIGLMLRGSAVMVTAISGGEINPTHAIFAMTVLFVIYGVAGGIYAAILTDLVQGILTIVLSFIILPFALSQVGGMAGLHKALDPEMFNVLTSSEITPFFIAIISLNALISWITQPGTAIAGATKTEWESRFGNTVGSLIKRFCTIAWTLTGLCAVVIYAGKDIDVDQVFGLMAHDLLPSIAPGLLGLFVASMLASVMSSCDAFMVVASGLFVENVYKPFIYKTDNDKHYILTGRIASVVVVAAGILFANQFDTVISGLEVFWKVAAMMGIAMWLGIFWRRTTVAGAWAGTLAGFGVWVATEQITMGPFEWNFVPQLTAVLPNYMFMNGDIYLPWQMIFYLTAGFVVTIVVSLVTKRVDSERLDRFYECLRTPITPDEPETTPCTLPEGVTPAPRRVLIDHPDFEIPVPSKVSVIGFLVICVVVVLVIYLGVWIFSLGQ